MEPDAGPQPEFLPQLRLDELLSELQSRLQMVLAARDQMRGLLEAVIAISSGLDLESTLRRIVETAVRLVDATYGALGVIGDGRLAEFIPASLRLGPGLRTLGREGLAEQALIVLRESLSNVARHAGATQADVTVDIGDDGFLTVRVTDNGTGIPAGPRRSGLRNLAERAAALGGELRLTPAEPAAERPGTRLEWRVPVTAPGQDG